jgi:hypothetical protein
MTYRSNLVEGRHWYISHEVLYAETGKEAPTEHLTVWENLILIRANSPNEAYKKAMKHGKMSEDKVRINGKTGKLRFFGLRDLVLIYEDLEDGAELEWHETQLTKVKMKKLLRAKERLHAFSATKTK